MVMLATDNTIPTYRLVDDAGTAVGRVIRPVTERISGPGAGTIYLQRRTPWSSPVVTPAKAGVHGLSSPYPGWASAHP